MLSLFGPRPSFTNRTKEETLKYKAFKEKLKAEHIEILTKLERRRLFQKNSSTFGYMTLARCHEIIDDLKWQQTQAIVFMPALSTVAASVASSSTTTTTSNSTPITSNFNSTPTPTPTPTTTTTTTSNANFTPTLTSNINFNSNATLNNTITSDPLPNSCMMASSTTMTTANAASGLSSTSASASITTTTTTTTTTTATNTPGASITTIADRDRDISITTPTIKNRDEKVEKETIIVNHDHNNQKNNNNSNNKNEHEIEKKDIITPICKADEEEEEEEEEEELESHPLTAIFPLSPPSSPLSSSLLSSPLSSQDGSKKNHSHHHHHHRHVNSFRIQERLLCGGNIHKRPIYRLDNNKNNKNNHNPININKSKVLSKTSTKEEQSITLLPLKTKAKSQPHPNDDPEIFTKSASAVNFTKKISRTKSKSVNIFSPCHVVKRKNKSIHDINNTIEMNISNNTRKDFIKQSSSSSSASSLNNICNTLSKSNHNYHHQAHVPIEQDLKFQQIQSLKNFHERHIDNNEQYLGTSINFNIWSQFIEYCNNDDLILEAAFTNALRTMHTNYHNNSKLSFAGLSYFFHQLLSNFCMKRLNYNQPVPFDQIRPLVSELQEAMFKYFQDKTFSFEMVKSFPYVIATYLKNKKERFTDKFYNYNNEDDKNEQEQYKEINDENYQKKDKSSLTFNIEMKEMKQIMEQLQKKHKEIQSQIDSFAEEIQMILMKFGQEMEDMDCDTYPAKLQQLLQVNDELENELQEMIIKMQQLETSQLWIEQSSNYLYETAMATFYNSTCTKNKSINNTNETSSQPQIISTNVNSSSSSTAALSSSSSSSSLSNHKYIVRKYFFLRPLGFDFEEVVKDKNVLRVTNVTKGGEAHRLDVEVGWEIKAVNQCEEIQKQLDWLKDETNTGELQITFEVQL